MNSEESDADFALALQIAADESSFEEESIHNTNHYKYDKKISETSISPSTKKRKYEEYLTAVRLSEKPNTPSTSSKEDEDYLLAMKLSQEFNSPELNAPSTSSKEYEDYLLALKMAEDYDNEKLTETGVDKENEDYLLAVKLAEEYDDEKLSVIGDNEENKDYLLALKLAEEYDNEKLTEISDDEDYTPINDILKSPKYSKNKPCISKINTSVSVVDPSLELTDPNPDIYLLFAEFNVRYFWGKLDGVEVKWSPRMTVCAGVCSYSRRSKFCSVRLSKPLLTLRPRKDLVETLLHEMIHAYLFVTENDRDRDGHGPNFHSHMYRINKESGTNISVYHNFHDEVKSFKTHWWRCTGPCQSWHPFYGYVKRSMNRAPGPNDLWWSRHQSTCNGKFVKIKEPNNYKNKASKQTDHSISNTNSVGRKLFDTDSLTKNSSKSNAANSAKRFKTAGTSSAANISNVPSTSLGDTKTKNNIVGFKDLAASPNKRPTISPKKLIPLPGQKEISQFLVGNAAKPKSNVVGFKELAASQTNKSPTRSPKKFIPLPGQKNIMQFFNRS